MTLTHILLIAILISNIGVGFLIYALGKIILEKSWHGFKKMLKYNFIGERNGKHKKSQVIWLY